MTEFHLGHVPGTVIVDKTELDRLRAVAEAAQGVINCLDLKPDDQVWDHASGGACLNLLDEALNALHCRQIIGQLRKASQS